jgi:hypothetical protein
VSNTFPMTPPASNNACAAAASDIGIVVWTIGRTRPSAIIGQTCSRTAATIAP